MHFCHATTCYPPHSFGGDTIGLQRLCHALAHHVDQFIAMGRFSRAKHVEFGFPAPMRVMPHPIPDADIAARQGRRAPPDTSLHPRPYFLFVGRLETITGVDSLLPAFAQYADADLLIVGEGHERRPLETAAAGNPRVHFLGRLDQERLARFYGAAIALIVPSVGYETFGLTLIESFLHSTPVIARRLGPFPEIIETSRGGELFENTDELLSAMRRLQSDPISRRTLGDNGFLAVRRYWSESTVIAEYLDIASEAIAMHSAKKHRMKGVVTGEINQVASGHEADGAKFKATARVVSSEDLLLKEIGMVPTTSPAPTVRDDVNEQRQLLL